MMIRVVIADDHTLFVEGIRQMLAGESDLECVGTAHDGRNVYATVNHLQPDILLLDIGMPGKSGIEICKELSKDFPQTRILALTMLDNASFIQQMMRSGASGYLLKDTGKEEFLMAIHAVQQGNTYISEGVREKFFKYALEGGGERLSFIPQLTRREKQVLNLIANEFTTQEIADQLHISLNTVETHRRNLLNKLSARNSAGLIRTAIEKGLLD